MKNIKTTIIALLLLTGASFGLASCEEDQVLPADITISPSGDGGGMEDEGQFD
jgi:hypothetical protein